jgi:hypothetical protein
VKDREQVINALSRAGKRALIHMIQAAIEGVKAVEAVIDELGKMDNNDAEEQSSTAAERIEVE